MSTKINGDLNMAEEKSISDIVALASAFYDSAVLFSALDNKIFEKIEKAGGEATLKQLAEATQNSERGLRLLLDGCVAIGILKKAGESYSNTQAGKLALVQGAPADLTRAICYNRDVYGAWGKLSQLVKTGEAVEPPSLHMGDDYERTRRFALSMRGRAMAIGRGAVPLIDLKGCKKLLDLAGGPAAYAELLVRANLELSCVSVDVPAISAVAKELVAENGLADRIECRPGDYHTDEYEEGAYDAVTIFGALHQESPEDIVDILKRARKALCKGGKIFIMDMMTDATHTAPTFSALFAVNMALTTTNGWVFSDAEIKGWLEEAGFVPGETQTVPPPMPHWIVSGIAK